MSKSKAKGIASGTRKSPDARTAEVKTPYRRRREKGKEITSGKLHRDDFLNQYLDKIYIPDNRVVSIFGDEMSIDLEFVHDTFSNYARIAGFDFDYELGDD